MHLRRIPRRLQRQRGGQVGVSERADDQAALTLGVLYPSYGEGLATFIKPAGLVELQMGPVYPIVG